MVNLGRAVIEIVQNASQLPKSWTDDKAVHDYLQAMVPGVSALVVQIVQAVQTGRLGIVGVSRDEVHTAIAEELELRGATLDPALIEALVTVILAVIKLLVRQT